MIEVLKSKQGHEILKYNGRNLSSIYDPEVEALKWVEKNQAIIRGVRNVFILGAGSGFHITSLRNAYPGLVINVFDPREDLVNKIKSRWSTEIMEIQFIRGPEDIVDKCLSSSFVILRHVPSWYGFEDQFFEMEKYLTGRFDLGFQRQLELRTKLRAVLDEKKILNSNEKTIHDLVQSIDPKSINEIEVSQLLAVAELVK